VTRLLYQGEHALFEHAAGDLGSGTEGLQGCSERAGAAAGQLAESAGERFGVEHAEDLGAVQGALEPVGAFLVSPS